MIAWLKAAWAAVVGFFGFWKSAATGQASEARAVDLEKHLVACIDGRQQEAARHAEVVKALEAENARLRDLVRRTADPGDVLDSLADPGAKPRT